MATATVRSQDYHPTLRAPVQAVCSLVTVLYPKHCTYDVQTLEYLHKTCTLRLWVLRDPGMLLKMNEKCTIGTLKSSYHHRQWPCKMLRYEKDFTALMVYLISISLLWNGNFFTRKHLLIPKAMNWSLGWWFWKDKEFEHIPFQEFHA